MRRANTVEGREFWIRYHRWGLQQWRLEVEQGFPLVRSIRSEMAVESLAIFDRWSPERRLALGQALIEYRLALAGEGAVSAEGEALSDAFWEMRRGLCMAKFFEHQRTMKFSPQAKKRLQHEVFEAVKPILGDAKRHSDPSTWCYTSCHGCWTVETEISMNSGSQSSPQLSYEHAVYLPDGMVGWSMSALNWMVLCPSTWWRLTSEDQIPEAAASLANACRRFMDASPVLLPE